MKDCESKRLYASMADVAFVLDCALQRAKKNPTGYLPRGYYYCNIHGGYHLTSYTHRGYEGDPEELALKYRNAV